MKTNLFIQQLDSIIETYNDMRKREGQDAFTSLLLVEIQALISKSIAAIHRISGVSSTYSLEVNRLLKLHPTAFHATVIVGIVKSLRDDLTAGYIQTLTEIVHSEVFSDFIEMAIHLLNNGYKDAAAVIVGSTLESHLKKLAFKNGIALENNGRSVKAESLNQEMAKSNVYTLLDQKNVTAWLDLRNKAAHGNYSEYNNEQVKLLIASVQDFMTRHQA